ncbi:MAG: alpha-L-fucosidase [Clostridia bacterium]|nr:alpha-L-fucosidase [Clostridia bacterium]
MTEALRPSEKQLRFMDWEFGAFFHFGIRSFFPGHTDWDSRPMPAEAFNPDQLDCGQWLRTVKEAGAAYAILVCKHHDGFANWPTKFSGYGVASAPWKDGKGDVVREFVDACREYGLKVGLYYSPAQWGGETSFGDAKNYDDYFIGQITELLTDYGKIDYLWFDGCGSEKHEFDKPRIIKAIRSLQPDILIFNMWDPDTRWIGNEDGYAPMNNPSVRADLDFSVLTTEKEALERARFLPAECDCMLRDTWFDCADNEDSIKTAEELMGMYEMSVGRGANFLLNIGPNRHGLLNEKDRQRVLEFGTLLKKRYGSPLKAFGDAVQGSENQWTLSLRPGEAKPLVNRVVIREELSAGERVRAFRVYAQVPGYSGESFCVYQGETIGHKAICLFPAIRTGRLTVEITQADGTAKLRDIRAYFAE